MMIAVGLAVVGLAVSGLFRHETTTPKPQTVTETQSRRSLRKGEQRSTTPKPAIATEEEPRSDLPPPQPAVVTRDTPPSPPAERILPRTELPAPEDRSGAIDKVPEETARPPRLDTTEAEVLRARPPASTDPAVSRQAPPAPIEASLADRVRAFRYPKTAEEIRSTLREILQEPAAPDVAYEPAAALRQLKAYRYLAGLPYRHLTLDRHFSALAADAADICRRLGHLTHAPENPGLPAEQYERARLATKNANLAFGVPDLATAVALWIDDSDERNIDRLGHRRWCLNPSMGKTGLGRVDQFAAMWVTDQVVPAFEDFAFVAYPVAGFMPIAFFNERRAWSLTLNPRDFRPPRIGQVEVRLYRVEGPSADLDHPLELDYSAVENSGFGLPNCLIFRPRSFEVQVGKRYWVDVKHLERSDGATAGLGYLVEFTR
jgi:hypothetical protein